MRAPGLILLCAVLTSTLPAQVPPDEPDNRSLGEIARELRHKKLLAAVENPTEPDAVYRASIARYLAHEDFAQLDDAADAARSEKSRFPGGAWKLYVLYEGVSVPATDKSSDAAWQAHLARLKRWIAANPQSITARVALAETYHNYASVARDTGRSDGIDEEAWRLAAERENLALQSLVEADSLPAKCPHWYVAMQHIALAQGWDKAHITSLLQQAIALEPGYYHLYLEHARMLLPRWYGEDGEAEAFAEEVSTRVGGKEGAFLYFELATVLSGIGEEDHLMSWPKIREGYAALVDLYGTSKLERNRFAMMAARARDKAAAQRAFVEIGDDWDANTWTRRASFDYARAWAMH